LVRIVEILSHATTILWAIETVNPIENTGMRFLRILGGIETFMRLDREAGYHRRSVEILHTSAAAHKDGSAPLAIASGFGDRRFRSICNVGFATMRRTLPDE
jgi:hypothetical protein